MATMRAKMKITSVAVYPLDGGAKSQENLEMIAVGPSQYPADGSDENNTFAKWTPSARLSMCIVNPALFGQYKEGDEFYVDFTPAT